LHVIEPEYLFSRNHGFIFSVVPDIGINEGIEAVRNILNCCWFDEIKCGKEISALEKYKKEWNDCHGCWFKSIRSINFPSMHS
jgi:hypothetical protein